MQQVGRAATLVRAAMTFRQVWAAGTLPPERIGKQQTPMCSTAYKYLFNACRVPHRKQDSVRLYPPAQNHHIAVAYRNQFYVVEVINTASDI
jgi:carnitine O-acetyltransferase